MLNLIFRKYILYNTKIIFGPQNKEITNLHLFSFYKVYHIVFFKLIFSLNSTLKAVLSSSHDASNK